MSERELHADELYQPCDPSQFTFEHTGELEPLTQIVGQPRAAQAFEFGVAVQHEGYNLFVVGPPGTGRHSLVRQFLDGRAPHEPTPDEWCYVNNFQQPSRPVALRLPAGRGPRLREDMDQLFEDVRSALTGALESEDHRERRRAVEAEYQQQQEQAFEELSREANQRDLMMLRTPVGWTFAPRQEGRADRPMTPSELDQLPDERQQAIRSHMEEMDRKAHRLMGEMPRVRREVRRRLHELDTELATATIRPLINELREAYRDVPDALAYFDRVEADMLEHAEPLGQSHSDEGEDEHEIHADAESKSSPSAVPPALRRRYRVNVLIERDPEAGAPVIYEDHPTLANLIGRIEHLPRMGTLLTDFMLIKAGALHRANGGYVILDAHRVLMQPLAWEALKRILRSDEIRIESMADAVGLISTVTLEPEPIPLRVKVVLVGSPLLYYLLLEFDPDFAELFKVPADFETDMSRSPDDQQLYARLIGTLAHKEGLRPLDRGAVARLIEQSSRLASDAQRLSIHMRSIADLLCEADHWARRRDNHAIEAEDVQHAIDSQVYRSDRLRQRVHEQIQRDVLLIDTSGDKIGQINGLAVIPVNHLMFGKPVRITARARMGMGELIDIEREVELGEAVHSKGVLILTGYLSGQYAQDLPLSLSASLVFEQSYSGVAGDSASCAELCALLSAIGQIPIKQSMAITGSVNQHGQIQPVGAINEKIEGFFDVCQQRGLDETHGVVIPEANAQHLMLRRDVVDAVREGLFHIHAIRTIDRCMELLTGLSAGTPDAAGDYPPESIHGRVNARLKTFAEQRQRLSPEAGDGSAPRSRDSG